MLWNICFSAWATLDSDCLSWLQFVYHALVAQRIEQVPSKHLVVGSIPAESVSVVLFKQALKKLCGLVLYLVTTQLVSLLHFLEVFDNLTTSSQLCVKVQ